VSKNDELELLEELYTLQREQLRDEARDDILAFTRYTKEDYLVNWHHQILCDKLNKFANGEIKRMMVFMPPQHGKLIDNQTLTPTPKGLKKHGDLKTGDYVFHPSGKPIKVISESCEDFTSIEMEFSNGEKIKCHPNHEWTVIKNRQKTITVEAKYFLNNKIWNGDKGVRGSRAVYQLPFSECLELDKKELLINPYCLGAWLGDGHKDKPSINSAKNENEIIDYFDSVYSRSSICVHAITSVKTCYYYRTHFWDGLKSENLIHNKHIPEHYIFSSKKQRLELLAGLIDTDGSLHKSTGQYRFININKRLIDDVCLLLSTLGYTYSLTSTEPRKEPNSSGIQDRHVCYQIGFTPHDTIPCKIPRKQSNKTPKKRKVAIAGIRKLTLQEQGKGKCIQVDSSDGLYLVGKKMIPTHNSELTSRRLPAYMLGQNPNLRIALCAYNATFASKFNRQVQRIMTDPAYNEIFPETRLNAKNVATDSKGAYLRNSEQFEVVGKNGSFISVGVGGGITGNPVDIALIDDPIKGAEEAGSQTYREKVWEWYTTELETRLNNNSQILITLTRWNVADIAGRILEASENEHARNWEVVVFPRIKVDNSNPDDPRKIGEVLWPEVHSMESAMEAKQRNPVKFEALQQQDPKVMEAGAEFYKSFDIERHTGAVQYDPAQPLHISLDENVNPYITGTIYQIQGKKITQVDEMCLAHPNNTVKSLAEEFEKRYPAHNTGVFVYGDATSQKEDTKLEKGQNFFTLFCNYIQKYQPSLRLPRSNPPVAMRGNWINSFLESGAIEVLIGDNCHNSVADFQFTKEDADGTKLKKKVKDIRTGVSYEKYGHTSDCFDYICCYAFNREFLDYQRGGTQQKMVIGRRSVGY
jgi:hypothetical protein